MSAITLDVNTFKTGAVNAGTLTSSAFSTIYNYETIFAIVGIDGNGVTGTVSGAGLSWTLLFRNNPANRGSIEVWSATTKGSILTSQTVTAASSSATSDMSLQIFGFADASPYLGATNSTNVTAGPATITISPRKKNSWLIGVAIDVTANTAATVGLNQTKLNEFADANDAQTHTYWQVNGVTSDPGVSTTLNLTTAVTNNYNVVAFEITPMLPAFRSPGLRPAVFKPGLAR